VRTTRDETELGPVVGFTLLAEVGEGAVGRARAVHATLSRDMPWIESAEITIGSTTLLCSSRGAAALFVDPAGDHWLMCGTPYAFAGWTTLMAELSGGAGDEPAIEGRWVVVRISSDGREWTCWQDWGRSIVVYHVEHARGGVLGNIEPAAVAAAALGVDHVSRRGLVELLVLGHFVGSDTLYAPMSVLPPRSATRLREGRIAGNQRFETVVGSYDGHALSFEQALQRLRGMTVEAIRRAATPPPDGGFVLPLSAGMDARLIATVFADAEVPLEALTYGPPHFAEVALAEEIARVTGHPWRRVDVGDRHLAECKEPWFRWFGSSLHLHGTYHYPLLNALERHDACFLTGWLGNSNGGGEHPSPVLFDASKRLEQRLRGYGEYWPVEEVGRLVGFDPRPHLDEIEDILLEQVKSVADWPHYEQMNMLDLWNRQSRFVYFQTEMFGWYAEERSPFMDRRYSTFCMSLPSHLKWKRRLQIEMLDRYWPEVAAVEGSYRVERGIVGGQWHRVRYHLAKRTRGRLQSCFGTTWYADLMGDAVVEALGDPGERELMGREHPLFSASEVRRAVELAASGRHLACTRYLALRAAWV